jgi:hypothetical protein
MRSVTQSEGLGGWLLRMFSPSAFFYGIVGL